MQKNGKLRDLLETISGTFIIVLFIFTFIMRNCQVRMGSMEPTFYEGQRVFVEKISFRLRSPKTGDIIVIKHTSSDPREKYLIKRVIATEGQTVSIHHGKVQVDGMTLTEPYLKEKPRGDYELAAVPEGAVFVMGDNRNRSMDSRDPGVGFLPVKNILGRVMVVYWPLTAIKIY